jgi:hypothetical protein
LADEVAGAGGAEESFSCFIGEVGRSYESCLRQRMKV